MKFYSCRTMNRFGLHSFSFILIILELFSLMVGNNYIFFDSVGYKDIIMKVNIEIY